MENQVFVSTVSGTYVPLDLNVFEKSQFGKQSFVKLLTHGHHEGFDNSSFVWDEPRWCYIDCDSNLPRHYASYSSVS